MKLNQEQIDKIDPLLGEELKQAQGDEEIRAVMTLEPQKPLVSTTLEPKQFPSPEAYRQALIDRRNRELAEALGNTISAIENLSLKVRGGKTSRFVVVQGTAKQILRSLELPGVRHATLDQLIALPETVSAETVKNIADIYIRTLGEDRHKRFGIFGRSRDQRTKQLVSQASEQYILNYYKRHNKLKILEMPKSVDLESLYTTVHFLDPQEIYRPETIETLEKKFRKSEQRSFKPNTTPTQVGIDVANKTQYLIVLGQPGGGKSTFLRKTGLEAMKGKKGSFKHRCIPIFIELKRFKTNDVNIEKAIIEESRSCGFPDADEFTHKALDQGQLLILLDGLDEIPTVNQEQVIVQLQKLVKKYDKNRFIASCRTAAYGGYFPKFHEVVIAEFNEAKIKQFIHNWFASEEDKEAKTAENCWELLNHRDYKAAKELAQTPLLLTFLCMVYEEYQDLPKNRAGLYKKALEILLEKWAAHKRVQRDPIIREFGIELEKTMLSEIAYKSFKEERFFLSAQEVISQIHYFLSRSQNTPKDLKAETVFKSIEIQQGILVKRAQDAYSFSHLTLQEYLTAQYIVDNHQIEQLVTQHLTDQRWREVFLLVAGLMPGGNGTDELLQWIEAEVQKYINTPKLRDLLNWADKVTANSEGNYPPGAKRAGAIALAHAIAYSNTKAIDIAQVYAQVIAPPIGQAIAHAKAYAQVYAQVDADLIPYAKPSTINILNHSQNLANKFQEIKIFKDVNWTALIRRLKLWQDGLSRDNQSQKVYQEFRKRILQTWCYALHLGPRATELSNEEIIGLTTYLNINLLILQCKQASVQVSVETWKGIEARMLLVTSE